MKIKGWGPRGLMPACGPEYIRYGGNTTCIEIHPQSGETIIIDAGTGIRQLGVSLLRRKIYDDHILFTHAHWDHIMGLPFFKPLHVQGKKIRMYHCPHHSRFVDRMLSDLMRPPYFPIRCLKSKADLVFKDTNDQTFEIGSIRIENIPLSHPNGGSGYKFIENGKSFVFLTDNELGYTQPGGNTFERYREFCRSVGLLIHDSEYTPEEYHVTVSWGPSRYTDALTLAMEAGVDTLGLFHLNQERTDVQMEAIVTDTQRCIATRNLATKCLAVVENSTFEL